VGVDRMEECNRRQADDRGGIPGSKKSLRGGRQEHSSKETATIWLLRAAVLDWLGCYLGNRSQRVKFNGVMSEPINVNLGVHQGSILGPLLFLLYINDITEMTTGDCSIRLFADDVLI